MEEKKEMQEILITELGKKEIQKTIIPQIEYEKATEEEFYQILKMVSPGTNFRLALDGALKTGKGALIVLQNERLFPLLDGGFRVNCKFTAQRLVELSKMDGAIILSKDVKRINYANVLLTPDSKIKTNETGTRHKAAERTAKQTSCLVIAISERKHEIHLFYKNIKYLLRKTEEILRKANEQIQVLEKQRDLFDKHLERLTSLELRNYPSVAKAISTIQKGRITLKISEELKRHIIELGTEGFLLRVRLKEMLAGVERETNLIIRDYTKISSKKSKMLIETLSYEELLDESNILSALGYENKNQDTQIKGWRVLSKTSMEEFEIAKLIKELGSLGKIIHSNQNIYAPIIGEENALKFKNEIERIKLNTY